MPDFSRQHLDDLKAIATTLQDKNNATEVEKLTAANTLFLIDGVASEEECARKHEILIAKTIAQTKKELKRDALDEPSSLNMRTVLASSMASAPPWLVITGFLVYKWATK